MAKHYMGFEGLIYFGSAGSTATTLLENCVDITYEITTETGDTTVRGDGTSPPINTSSVTARVASITFSMRNVAGDTSLEALRTAAAAGTLVAIRTKDHSAGKGFDGDCHLTFTNGKPLRGEQTQEFTATPSRDIRVPQLYV